MEYAFSFIIGAVAKIFGKAGVFYARCRQASLIDDVTGTMPPFDKCLVYGPADTDRVCEEIKMLPVRTERSLRM